MTTQPPIRRSRPLVSGRELVGVRWPLPEHIAKRMTERQFQTRVTTFATAIGWWVYHPYDSRRSREGWPDLTLIRGSRLLFLELKTQSGRIRPEQLDVITRLKTAGQTALIVRPSDWPAVVDELVKET